MTGDSSRRKQALSVFLSTLMVLSVLAMGMAGFAGSAAANPFDDAEDDAFIYANPAEAGTDDAQFVATMNLTGDDSITDGDTFEVQFPNGGAFDTSNVDSDTKVSVSIVDSDGDVHRLDDDGTNTASVSSVDGDDTVQITFDGSVGPLDYDYDETDTLRVVIGTGSSGEGINIGSGASATTDVTVELDASGTTQTEDIQLGLNDSAPIQMSSAQYGAGSQSVEFTSSLQSAASLVDSTDETITVNSDVNEFLAQPTPLGSEGGTNTEGFEPDNPVTDAGDGELTSGSVTLSNQNTTIEAGSDGVSATFATVDASATPDADRAIETNADDHTITGVDLASSDVLGDHVGTAVSTKSNNNDGVEVSNLEITEFTSASTDAVIELGDSGGISISQVTIDDNLSGTDYTGVDVDQVTAGDLDIDQLTANNVSTGTGVQVADSSDDDLFVNITDSTAELAAGGAGFDIDLTPSGSENQQLNIDNPTVKSDDNAGGTGVVLRANDGSGIDADIDGGSLDNVTYGVDAGNTGSFSGENLNITGLTMTNLGSDTGIDLTDGSLANANIDDVEIQGDGSDTVGVDLNDGSVDADVANSVINSTDIGVYLQGVSTAAVRNTEIDNAASQAVLVETPGADADIEINESTSIDQAGGQGIDIDLSDAADGQFVDVNDVTVNGSSGSGVKISDLQDSGGGGTAGTPTVNVTSSTLSQNAIGFEIADNNADKTVTVNAHFNDITNNDKGVEVADLAADNGDVYNVTFNDITNSQTDGLDVAGQSNDNTINANYSWWDNRDSSRIVGPYTLQNAGSQLPSPRRVYEYTRLHTGGQP